MMGRPSHSDHVLQQLNNQREWGFLCDCLIAIGDIYFRAHKAVLAACSSYFRMMFIRDQQETGRLDLSNMHISAECFDLILQFMYLGRIVVSNYEFEELKASMVHLQMYYIPDSVEDLRDIRSTNPTPSSSASSSSSSSSTGQARGKMMFGVRMYEQQRPSVSETERLPAAVSTISRLSAAPASTSRPTAVEEVVSAPLIVVPPVNDGALEQPCDLRKRASGRGSTLKDRPRFGRTYTCDDCGFVFSCEKLLIEHILTCTNRKAYHPSRCNADTDNDSSKTESSASEGIEEHQIICKGEADWPEVMVEADLTIRTMAAKSNCEAGSTNNISIKTEPQEIDFPEIEEVQVSDLSTRDSNLRFSDHTCQNSSDGSALALHPDVGVSKIDSSAEAYEAHMSTTQESGIPLAFRKVQQENEEVSCPPCELCGALLTEEDKSSHYLSNHMSHICACGRCGQVLIKGRQLQEHAERCADSHGGQSDSHGEDEASLLEEPQGMEDGLIEPSDLSCTQCGLLFQSESLALEHTLACHEQDMFRPGLLEEGIEPDHRRKHFCNICGKGFYQRCHLREHYTVHTKEKQFTCQTCGKQFLRERQLRLHTDMHKGMARYVCPVCDQGAFLKHDHVRHMISHLADGETICQVCFQIFPGGEHLEKHMDVHLYICGVCGEKFRLRKDMRSHYNWMHTKRL